MMAYENILYKVKDRIATVTLNRPEYLNGFAPGMTEELTDVFYEMAQDDEVLVSILTGAGRAFCAGHFMKDRNSAGEKKEWPKRAPKLFSNYAATWEYPKPLIGAINGDCYGGGLNYVLGCDIIIASTQARFCFPQARIGIIPAWPGAPALALFVGKAKAAEMALMSRPMSGEDAYRWGLANKVVPHDQLMDEARAWAQEIAGLAPISTRLIKDDLRESWEVHFNRSANRLRFAAVSKTEDCVEGDRAFKEKRAPVFKGR